MRNLFATLALLGIIISGSMAGELFAGKAVTAADGYEVRRVAEPPLVSFPMFAAFDDEGRLFVAESSGGKLYEELANQARLCTIRLLEDRNGDGEFDHATTFAEDLAFPMGLAWHDGELYVADPPHIIALRDTTNDGRADQRRIVLGDFGHQTNGSLHGLIFGPDGYLYMTMGMPDGFNLKENGETVATGSTSGALIRCRPDGSGVEVLARGFENLVELAFSPDGVVFGTNNWHQVPANGIRDSLLHLVPGGIYPRHPPTGTPHLVQTGEPLPAIELYPALGISGLSRWRAQEPGSEGENIVFSAQFNTRKVVRHHLRREGATFITEDTDLIQSDNSQFKPSDVLEDADGSLLVLDTGVWYGQYCPATQTHEGVPGGIYRVEKINAPQVRDPWGQSISWRDLETRELIALVEDPRPFVAERAQHILASDPRVNTVKAIAKHLKTAPMATEPRAALIWALARIGAGEARDALETIVADASPTSAAAAARGLGLIGNVESRAVLEPAIGPARPPHVRLAAAEALARCGTRDSLPALWQALADDSPDRMLEHAIIYAIAQLATTDDLLVALDQIEAPVQRAALILLEQPPHDALTGKIVRELLNSPDANVRAAGIEMLIRHPEWELQAEALLQDWLDRSERAPSDEAVARLLEAFGDDRAVIQLLVDAIAGRLENVDTSQRKYLITQLTQGALREKPGTWVEPLGSVLKEGSPDLLSAAVDAVAALRLFELDPILIVIISGDAASLDLKLSALQAVISRHANIGESTFATLRKALADQDLPARRLAAAEIIARAELNDQQLQDVLDIVGPDSLIWPTLLPAFNRGEQESLGLALIERLEQMSARGQWSVDEERLRATLEPYPPAVHSAAESLYASGRARSAGQQPQLDRYKSLMRGGDSQRGQIVFAQRAACLACHRVQNRGGEVGPDLTRIAAIRSEEEILQSTVLPNLTTAQGYQTYLVTLTDGRALMGTRADREGHQLSEWQTGNDGVAVLRDPSGQLHHLPHGQIREIQPLNASLMPEGLLHNLSEREIRDLFAYLLSLR